MPDDFNKNTSIEDEIEKSLQKMVEEETTVAKAYVGKADDYKAEQPSDINDGRTRVVPKITDEILKEQQVINKSSQPTQEELTDRDILLDDDDDEEPEDEDKEILKDTTKKPLDKKTKLIIAGVAAGVALVLIIIIIVAVSLNKKSKNNYNYYYQTGDDEWVYELSEVVLKPEQTPRYGSLVIDKTLRDFNATSGAQATFVFQIDITTLEGKTESRVEAMTMGAGEESQQLTIDQIPAGASVRVRETYSGASYTQVSDDPDDVTIFADEAVRVSFENAHDGRPNGGYGVKNNFKLDENKQYQYTGDNVSTD